jgi:hypothetical protein
MFSRFNYYKRGDATIKKTKTFKTKSKDLFAKHEKVKDLKVT